MGPLTMYDNDRMKIDVDVAYEDDECVGNVGFMGEIRGLHTQRPNRYKGEKGKDEAVKVSGREIKENSRYTIWVWIFL